jgi:replicative DNA helicase Mcm
MAFSDNQQQIEHVEQYTEFLALYYRDALGELAQQYPKEQQSLTVEWMDLYRFNASLAESFREDPAQHTEFLDEAVTQVDLPVDVSLTDATVRVQAPETDTMTYSVDETRADHCGTYLALSGQLSKASAVRPKLVEGVFECQRCGSLTTIPQTGDELREPHECQGCERQGPFRLSNGRSTFVDHQRLRLQQLPEEVNGGTGRHIDVHVKGTDFVDELQAGDRVTISGTYELGELDESTLAEPYLAGRAARVEQTDYEEIDVDAHRDRIEQLAAGEAGDPFECLLSSLAPKIHGHTSIKLAIILQLFGGNRVEYPTDEADRGDSHILLLGDPGTAKSSLLQAVEELAPRSAAASGKGASASGLTAAAVSDDFGETQWSLDAGALVLADKGIACIDELDKIDEAAVSSLHGALESQRVSVNKAGINTTLPCRTALLAAGNPKYGRFDEYEALADQVDIAPTLLSRFDLLFMLQDQPDEEDDRTIATHMVDYRQEGIAAQNDGTESEEFAVPVSAEVFRAWIAHAKRSVQPRICDESVKEDLVSSFVSLRQINPDDGPVPVTLRKLEGLQRLAEASARVRLSETVETEDVSRARNLVGESMRQVGLDPETGEYDADVVETGTSHSQHERIQSLLSIISESEVKGNVGAPIDVIIDEATAVDITASKARETLQKLRDQGKVYSPATDEFCVTQ